VGHLGNRRDICVELAPIHTELLPSTTTGNHGAGRSSVACVFDADCGASSCPTDDHHFVAFGVGDPPAILRLVEEPTTRGDGHGEPRRREVRGHRELDVEAMAALGPDAVPAIVAGAPSLTAADAAALQQAMCAEPSPSASGAAYNGSKARAHDLLLTYCEDGGFEPGG